MIYQQPDIKAHTGVQPLLVACSDASVQSAIQRLIGLEPSPFEVLFLDSVEEALDAQAAAPVLVPIKMPIDHVSAALQVGTPPGDALAGWRQQAESTLARCRKARRRIVLLDADMLLKQPEPCMISLGERLGTALEVTSRDQWDIVDRSSLHAVLAAALIAADARARDLFDELEAMATGPVTPCLPDRDDIDAAVRAVGALTEERNLLRESLRKQTEEAERRRSEKDMLQGRLEQQKQELAKLKRDAAARADDLAQSEARRSNLEGELDAAQGARDALTEERDLLRESLRQVIEDAERVQSAKNEGDGKTDQQDIEFGDKRLCQAQLDAVTRQMDEARETSRWREAVLSKTILRVKAETDMLLTSKSWKVTAPLRAVRRAFGRA